MMRPFLAPRVRAACTNSRWENVRVLALVMRARAGMARMVRVSVMVPRLASCEPGSLRKVTMARARISAGKANMMSMADMKIFSKRPRK